jgi:hypothetical protein
MGGSSPPRQIQAISVKGDVEVVVRPLSFEAPELLSSSYHKSRAGHRCMRQRHLWLVVGSCFEYALGHLQFPPAISVFRDGQVA